MTRISNFCKFNYLLSQSQNYKEVENEERRGKRIRRGKGEEWNFVERKNPARRNIINELQNMLSIIIIIIFRTSWKEFKSKKHILTNNIPTYLCRYMRI